MKKNLLTILLVVMVAIADAQTIIGVKAGAHRSLPIMHTPDGFNMTLEPHWAFHGGLFTSFRLSNKLSLVPELHFIQKGYTLPEIGPRGAFRANFNYIEFPVLVSFAPFRRLLLEAGPVAAASIKAQGTEQGNPQKLNMNAESFEWGATGGIRFFLTDRISISTRYSRAFTNATKIGFRMGQGPQLWENVYNSNLQFAVYYAVKKLQ